MIKIEKRADFRWLISDTRPWWVIEYLSVGWETIKTITGNIMYILWSSHITSNFSNVYVVISMDMSKHKHNGEAKNVFLQSPGNLLVSDYFLFPCLRAVFSIELYHQTMQQQVLFIHFQCVNKWQDFVDKKGNFCFQSHHWGNFSNFPPSFHQIVL